MTGGDEAIGVPLDRAAAIIGITRTRLIHWAQIDLLRPAGSLRIASKRRWIYSFEDLVSGRVIRAIEQADVDIRHISHIVRRYRQSGWLRPLTTLRWGVDKSVTPHRVFLGDAEGWLDGRAPGQGVLTGTIDIEEIRTNVRRAVRSRQGEPGKLVSRAGRRGSRPVFEGTRVPLETIVRWIKHGASDERILAAYPTLTPDDLRAAREEMAQAS